jgi:hypothetical protein
MKPLAAIALCLAAAGALASCGIFTAPISVPAAVASNANYSFHGPVVDQNGNSLDGVIMRFSKSHHFWTPIKGGTDIEAESTRRVDHTFDLDERGSFLEVTFSKDGYYDAGFRFMAESKEDVTSSYGTWPNIKNFPVVLLTKKPADALLDRFNAAISYSDYPIATCIAIDNVATNGRTGDIQYLGKDAQDPTVFPPGTLYLTLVKEAPPAMNVKGEIDPAELDIPGSVTLHLAGKNNGFLRIEPKVGFHPIATSDTAPDGGYVPELTFPRARLKAMRSADPQDIILAHEYFFFRANNRYGKGVFSWENRAGKPSFRYELYVQPEQNIRDLTTHGNANYPSH